MAWSRQLAVISLAASLVGGTGCTRGASPGGDGGDDAWSPCGPGDDRDGDGIGDLDEGDGDPDGDGVESRADRDADGDDVEDAIEAGDTRCDTAPIDTDRDGTPDFLDLDSDGDTIADAHEGARDADLDGEPNFRDLDADDDGVPDADEAGDGDVATPPAICAAESPPDGVADYADLDRDDDGLADGEELALGTDPCDVDSDDDGQSDLVEGAYEGVNCPGGVDCGCATSASCTIPPQHFYVVLAQGESTTRDLEFGTSIRRADVFFLVDTTASMGPTLAQVRETIATTDTGLVDRITRTIPEAWFGGGELRDFPFAGHGGIGDEPLRLAMGMRDRRGADALRDAFVAMEAAGGGDPPEAQTEALLRVVTGERETWTYRRSDGDETSYSMPSYAGDCLETTWGAPCFRDASLPVIVLFTDTCARNGPEGESIACGTYDAVTPAPASWDAAIGAMNARSAKLIGVNTSTVACETTPDASGYAPCFFLRRTAEATGSVDVEGRPLVYDLPGSADLATFATTVASAVERLATRVPVDVDTVVRDDPGDEAGVDARAFVGARVPACRAGASTCWSAPEGVAHEDAVGGLDDARFLDVVPGTRITFRITFRNETRPGGARSEVHVAFVDVRAEGTAILDTRQVYVVVPANDDFRPG
ncbi:MSCRAMM family adhesin SdrC [Sandaracinus amylolyticus]|uniref:MSCRAMM family adhesin SdrC n=1 Tax=Sandaracinus amylolyticus TaxID=927083 RepID=UPI001F44F631|nr:MSCRAMM family adhesin SdrC [Sandaracinus amylolyticus]UJR85909.1 Hypothetical protein I5071_79890 [Sandaracinus amylolyticus]